MSAGARAVLFLACLVAAPCWAAGPLAFPAVDNNHDGFVSWDEARRSLTKLAKVHFEKCDMDGDGLIDKGEYPLLSSFYWQTYMLRD